MSEVQNGADYDNMSVEELETEFARTGGVIEDNPEAAPEPEPEPQAEPELEPAAEVAAESVEAETAQSDTPPSNDDPPEPDDRDLHLQELQLTLERERVAREQADLIASRNAGMMGHLQKQIQQLSAERARPAAADDPLDYEDVQPAESHRGQPQPHAGLSRHEEEVAELRTAHRNSTVKEVYSDFLNRVAEDLSAQGVEQTQIATEQQSLIEKITPTLRERFEPFGDLTEMKNQTVGKITRMVLDSAYTDQKLAKIADLRRQSAERRTSQISQSRIVKQAASSSGSGSRSVQESPPKNVEDMTAEEADAALIAEYGTGKGRIRARR